MKRARIIQLSDDDLDGSIRLLSGAVSLAEGQTESWETLTRIVKFKDDFYGEVDISRAKLNQMVRNFKDNTYGHDISIDVSHRPDLGGAGFIRELTVEKGKLRSRIEWTQFGIDAVIKRGFRYFSIDYHENYPDPETGKKHGALLRGAGLTTRPRVKRLDPVDPTRLQLSFDGDAGDVHYLVTPLFVQKLSEEIEMLKGKYVTLLGAALSAITALPEDVSKQLSEKFGTLMDGITDEANAKVLLNSFTAMGETFGKQLAEAGQGGTVQLDLTQLQSALAGIQLGGAGLDKVAVAKMLAEHDENKVKTVKQLAEKRDANIKLFTDAINGQDAFSDELKKKLTENSTELITPDMSADQIKALSDNQIGLGNQMAADAKLKTLGYQGGTAVGSPHITVDESNNIKALQETADRRMGILDRADSQRFAATGGSLPEENKKFVDKVLAEFDRDRAVQLHAEFKMLAGGDGVVSDVAVPVVWERTVLREALYQIIGLQFVNVGTDQFASSYSIPYSYRDTTAAGINATRKFEGQSIQRAGVIQTAETAYNIPQKLAFEVSDELRYLTAARHLNWDATSENQMNASRIIAEDTERLIFNETLNSADEYAATNVANEVLTSDVDGTNNVFPLANFPVVHPRAVYDLQGNQVGSTTNAIVVTYDSVVRTEWPGAGAASGTYYTMDYNQGEVRLVDETGTVIVPPNATALLVSYNYTTNCYKFDTDLGSALAEDHWNTFLYRFGLRKAIIEDDRYHTANYGLMSGTVANQVEQAKQFAANFRRPATELSQNGNIGRIKDVAQYKATAPGLFMGDQRIIIGERGISRYRMTKAWTMGALENQKDSNGRFTGKKEAYGDQFVVLHTPTQLKAALTSIVLYSATGRVARAA